MRAIEALGRFESGRAQAILRGLDRGMRPVLRACLTTWMQGLGNGAATGKNPGRPPNPPPGPIGIRTGRLRRAVTVIAPRQSGDEFETGLQVDLNAAPYGRIHELGGTTRPHEIRPRVATMLRWRGVGPGNRDSFAPNRVRVGKDGKITTRRGARMKAGSFGGFDIFARSVKHPGSKIPARPYMRPALERGLDAHVYPAVDASLAALAASVLR